MSVGWLDKDTDPAGKRGGQSQLGMPHRYMLDLSLGRDLIKGLENSFASTQSCRGLQEPQQEAALARQGYSTQQIHMWCGWVRLG